MSRFFTERLSELKPYTPGEQPQNRKYIKLNTNESPFPPSPGVRAAVADEAETLRLYSDPESRNLTDVLAAHYHLKPEQILVGNGSDDLLNFAFLAFCDDKHPALFPDVTYGFYPVLAQLNRVPFAEIPLKEDLSIQLKDYYGRYGTIFLANPNAPTGLFLPPRDIELLLQENTERLVVVDEAYVEFGGESVLPMIDSYNNLLVIHTFSKSHSLAGARLGFAVGNPALIQDMNTLKYSTNPYNVNRMTSAAGIAALKENDYYQKNAAIIMNNREYTAEALRKLGFTVTDSKANFLFASTERINGGSLYQKLKERGILIRHFSLKRIDNWVRITVGSREEMDALLKETEEILQNC